MAIWQRTHAVPTWAGSFTTVTAAFSTGRCATPNGSREQDLVASVGSRGDSYDNALAEAFNSLFKAELIRNRHKGPWRDIDDMEIAVAEYIDWFNHRRIHGEIGYVPPAEYEARHAAVEPSPEPVDDLVDAR